jgi:hypothetical protein
MKLGPSRTKLSFRTNGTRLGAGARPASDDDTTPVVAPVRPARTLPARRPMPALVIRDYRDELDDDGVAS